MRNGSSNTESPPPAPSSPRAPPQRLDNGMVLPGTQRFVITSAALALGIAGLYFGRSVLVPLAFAAFLAFVLDPIVAWLRRWHLPRAAAVTVVIVLALGVLGGVAAMLTQQVGTLAQELPTYRSTIHKKLVDLQPQPGSSQVMTKATRAIDMVEQEINAARIALEPAIRATPAATRAPTRVVVQTEPLPPLRALASLLEPIVVPLVSTGLVFVLLAFLLVERRELRDRVIRLTGGDLHLMSEAMNESARRVSRYLGAQLLVNLGYGLPMAVGLWWIGVPGAWLWGFMAAVLRFVPYLGFAVAAIFPLVLAFAVDPGWSMVLWTMALVLSLEILIANIVEPLAYGRRTGVSPVAVLLSAGFWTLVWGPVGLVLATPITVCLVVMGRHLGPLRFLNVLLGTEPVFNPPTKLYHRLISGDLEEAIELSHETMKREGLMAFYSATAVPMLALAATPSAREASAAQRHRIVTGAARIIEDLSRDIAFRADAQNARVLCLGARNEMDTLSAEMLAHVLREQGTAARALPAVSLTAGHIAQLDLSGVALVYLCTFNPAPQTFTRYVSRQLRRRAADVEIVLAAWVASDALRERDAVHDLGADDLAVSLVEAVGHAAAVQALALPAQLATPQSDHRDNLPPAPSWEDELARCAQRAAEIFGMALATVTVRTGVDTCTQASAGAPSHDPLRRALALDKASALAHVLSSGELLVVPDLEREPRFAGQQDAGLDGLHFLAAAPIVNRKGQVLGVLALHDAQASPFADEERDLLETLASDMAQLLLGAHLLEPMAMANDPGDQPPGPEATVTADVSSTGGECPAAPAVQDQPAPRAV